MIQKTVEEMVIKFTLIMGLDMLTLLIKLSLSQSFIRSYAL
jgi:hypothetical protein